MRAPRTGARSRASRAGTLVVVVGGLLASDPAVVRGQETAGASAAATVPVVVTQERIPLSSVPVRAEAAEEMVRRAMTLADPSDVVVALEQDIDALAVAVREERRSLDLIDEQTVSIRQLDDQRVSWTEGQARAEAIRATLRGRWSTLVTVRDELESARQVWDVTLDTLIEAGEEPQLEQRVTQIRDAIADAVGTVDARVDLVADLIVRTTRRIGIAGESLERVDELTQAVRVRLLTRDAAPLWDELRSVSLASLWAGADVSSRYWFGTLSRFVSVREGRFAAIMVVLGSFVLVALLLWRSVPRWPDDEALAVARHVVSRPLSLAALMTLAVAVALLPQMVGAMDDAVVLLALVPVARLGAGLVAPHIRSALYGVSGVLVLELLTAMTPEGSPARRLVLLLVSAVALVGAVYLLRRWDRRDVTRFQTGRVGTVGIHLAAGALAVSFLANLGGWFGLAELLWQATVASTYGALAWLVFYRAAVGLLPLLARSLVGRFIPSIVRYEDTFVRRTTTVLAVVIVALWARRAMLRFLIWEPVAGRVEQALSTSIVLGGLVVSVGSLLVAVVILALTFPVARLVRFLIREEVLRRVSVPQGTDHTIVAIANYTVILFGLLLSASAAGLTGTQLTVVFGAVGVGIGFGLQNIVNNFVSGLILMFERPVKVGDKIEVAGRAGVVTQIGMRASQIHAFDGADVVIPNGELISKEVVNWTLTDSARRVEVIATATGGTDVQRVVDILQAAASGHHDTLAEPPPRVLMTGFGGDGLSFRVQAWTTGDPLALSSDLNRRVNDDLEAAGIDPPAPRQDLHLAGLDEAGPVLVAATVRDRLSPA